jgi:hypothetical protein
MPKSSKKATTAAEKEKAALAPQRYTDAQFKAAEAAGFKLAYPEPPRGKAEKDLTIAEMKKLIKDRNAWVVKMKSYVDKGKPILAEKAQIKAKLKTAGKKVARKKD